MKNIKIKYKLTVSFAIIITLLAIMGVAGLISVASMNKAGVDMYENNVIAINTLASIRENYAVQRATYRNFMMYDPNSDYFKNAIILMSELEGEMDVYINLYRSIIVGQEDEEDFNNFVNNYYGGFDKLKKQITLHGQQKQYEQAKEVLADNSSLQLSNSINDSLDRCYEFNLSHVKEVVDGNTSQAYQAATVLVLIFVVVCIVSVILTIHVSGLISNPLTAMTKSLEDIAKTGNITLNESDIEQISKYSKFGDETGICVKSVAGFVERMIGIEQIVTKVAEGDLTIEVGLLSDKDNMGMSLRKMITNLREMFSEINNATLEVTNGSEQISQGAQTLARGSVEQAAAIEQLSSSISEVAKKTKDNSEMANNAASLATSIKVSAEKSNKQMDDMMSAVTEINQANKNISKVIKAIDDIAFQTNILALNAAVEAARAGDAGKGFAVVAEEVRSLAAKSAESAKDTENLINNSIEKAEWGVHIADEAAKSLAEIVKGINESNVLIGNIASLSDEQSTAIRKINHGIEQVSQVIQENSAAAQESAATSEEMNSQAISLEKLVEKFRIKEK